MSAARDHVPINCGYHSMNAKLLIFAGTAVLLIAVTLTFIPAIHNGFVDFDDPLYILENPHVQAGLDWQGVRWAFTTGYGANWHPVTWLSHLMDCQLFKLRPWGHHLTSVILHLVNTLFLLVFLQKATGAVGRSLVVAALFGVHPLHVESVAWIAERKDVLSTTFWMLGMLSYGKWVTQVKSTGHGSILYYALTIIIFALGLMSKPMVVTFPLALLLLDYWPLERFDAEHTGTRRFLKLLFEKWPLFLLSIASAGVTYLVQRQGGAMEAKNYFPMGGSPDQHSHLVLPLPGKIFYPINLSPYYIHPTDMACRRGALGNAVFGGSLGGRVSAPPPHALPLFWMVLVHYHLTAGHWHRPSWDAVDRRSLHLRSFDRNFHRRLLESAEARAGITGDPPHFRLGYYQWP